MKKILVINANPKADSFCISICQQYANSADKHHQVEILNIGDMCFETNLSNGYDTSSQLEPDLLMFQQKIKWSEHIVIVSPVWWGTVPAKFKGAIDRAFLPNFAFKYSKGKAIPEKLLMGRTSELIITLDTPTLWYKIVRGNPIYKQLKRSILDFSGIKNISATYFGPVISSNPKQRLAWLDKVSGLSGKLGSST